MQQTKQKMLPQICGVIIALSSTLAATLPLQQVLANEQVINSFIMDDASSRAMEAEYQKQVRQQNRALALKAKQRQQSTRKVTPTKRGSAHRPAATPQRRHVPVTRHTPPKHQPDAEDLFRAASSGNVDLISRLLSQGVNINASNRERETALHMAAAKGHYSAVIYLVKNGANVNALTVKNWIPLHHAVRFRHHNIAKYLIQQGSYVAARTSDGLSATDMARTANNKYMLSIISTRR